MLDLARIVGFDWDAGNVRKSADKHGVTQAEAEQVFADEKALVSEDIGHSKTEVRYQALGESSEGRHLHIAFTLRREGALIRIISAGDMNRKERACYEAQA